MTKKTHIGINVTRRCNMKCSFCYYTTLEYNRNPENENKNLDLSLNVLEERLEKINNIGDVYITGGEPLLYNELKSLINKLIQRSDKILVCTNGLLLNDEWINYFVSKNIILVISLKDSSEKTRKKLNKYYQMGLKIELYHVLSEDTLPIVKLIPQNFFWVEKIRLLFETSSDCNKNIIPAKHWFALLNISAIYLKDVIEKVEVEVGYVQKNHAIANDPNRGAVNRIILDFDGRVYPCPLIVEKGNGCSDINERPQCKVEECPVLKQNNFDDDYIQICPFIITNLKSFLQ
ncbi:MAG: radical SAM protein [Bacteroidales bacterium]|nr:radical SAM protein [Bacteroidales bacterium]